jgi:hypothetical protein
MATTVIICSTGALNPKAPFPTTFASMIILGAVVVDTQVRNSCMRIS